jgi:hypothetical protein
MLGQSPMGSVALGIAGISSAIDPGQPTVTGVTIAPLSVTVSGGATRQFAATVQGQNSPSQSVNWLVTAGAISATGLFTAPAAIDVQQSITVTAKSVLDPSFSATATVLVPAASVDPDPPRPSGRDFTWLVASVKSWSRRSDLATVIPDLVMMAEERMSADLDARGLESVTTIATSPRIASVPLPVEVVEVRSVGMPGFQPLGFLSADAFSARYSVGDAGTPRHYTTIGDALYLGPMPDTAYQLKVDATKTLPPLSDDFPTNWLIARNPGLYLAATMVEAMINLRDPEGQQVWEGKYAVALNAANSTKGTAGQLVVRSDTKTP